MKKILVIEDDQQIIDSISDLFENEGFIVYKGINGMEGIQLAKKYLPDIILSDIAMPGINGYEVLKELQKDDETSVIPFIFLTAKVEKSDFRLGMELGADDYITKPFKLDELLRATEARLKKNENIRTAPLLNSGSVKKLSGEEHIFIHYKDHPLFIKVNDIVYITADAEYSNVFLISGKKIMVRKLLKKWDEILPDSTFLRISRYAIINLNYLLKIDKWFNNSYVVYIKDVEEPLVISRRFAASLRAKLA